MDLDGCSFLVELCLRRLKEEEKERCEKGKQNTTRIKTCYCYLRRRFVPLSSAHLRGRLRASRSRRATSERLALIFCGTKNYKSSVRLSVCFCISIFNFLIETLIPTGSGRKAFFPTPLTMVDPRPFRYKAPAQDMGMPEAGRCLCNSYVKVSANSDKYSMRKHHCNNQPRKNTNKMVKKQPLTDKK